MNIEGQKRKVVEFMFNHVLDTDFMEEIFDIVYPYIGDSKRAAFQGKLDVSDKDINDLIKVLREECIKREVLYNKDKERFFARHILTSKDFTEFAKNIGQDVIELAVNVLKASIAINYWKGPCTGPRSIYKNFAEVYNLTKKEQEKRAKITDLSSYNNNGNTSVQEKNYLS